MFLTHPWEPVYDQNSRILILGTFPSPKSREFGFYFGHPRNLFWKTLAQVLEEPEPDSTIEARKEFLLRNHIALGDTVYSCDIEGAADASIKNVTAFDFTPVFAEADIQAVFTTGKAATHFFQKFSAAITGLAPIYLPSTSAANGIMHRKPEYLEQWQQIRKYL
jgi:hypoxanthine-DNA glycosylase